MVVGFGCAALAFVASGVVQLAIDRSLERTSAEISVFWQVPQYVFITLGEVMVNITGLEFAYSQAPSSMKSLLQGAWNLTVAIGKLHDDIRSPSI
jgi:dipeptide/tripeptide permease